MKFPSATAVLTVLQDLRTAQLSGNQELADQVGRDIDEYLILLGYRPCLPVMMSGEELDILVSSVGDDVDTELEEGAS